MRRSLLVFGWVMVLVTAVIFIVAARAECQILVVSELEKIDGKTVVVDSQSFELESLIYANDFNRRIKVGELVTVAEFGYKKILCCGELEPYNIWIRWFWVHSLMFGLILSISAGLLTEPLWREYKKLFRK